MDSFIHRKDDNQEWATFLSTYFSARGDALPPFRFIRYPQARTGAEATIERNFKLAILIPRFSHFTEFSAYIPALLIAPD